MIITENITRDDGATLIKHYSDAGFMMRQNETGVLYSEAIDVENSGYTYSETEIPAEDNEVSAQEALDILMGGDGNADDETYGHEIP